jgi:hypothetical protein
MLEKYLESGDKKVHGNSLMFGHTQSKRNGNTKLAKDWGDYTLLKSSRKDRASG